jgi:hypothetical protein
MASMLVSLLPEMYRRRVAFVLHVDAGRGALLSGVAQCVVCTFLFCFGYLEFLQFRVGKFASDLIAHSAEDAMGNIAVQWGAGMVSLGEYMIRPLTLALVYFGFEGLVRFGAAVIHGETEIIPTLPLQLIAWAHTGLRAAKHRHDLDPLVEDQVFRDGISPVMRIATCRPKPWNALTTISYEDKLYELAQEEQGEPPRRYVYVLRPRPEHKVVRGLYEYDPQELVREPENIPAR